MTQVLKYIKEVSCIEPWQLSSILHVPGLGVLLKEWRDFKPLPTVGLAEMTVTSSVEAKSRLFTTKLTCTLSEPLAVKGRRLCYLATAVDGSRYLIGGPSRPYPVTNTEDRMPDRESDSCGCTLTVEYTGTMGLARVLD